MARKISQWMLSIAVICSFGLGLVMPTGAAVADSTAPAAPQGPGIIYTSNFEADNGGFTAAGTDSTWAWGVPTVVGPATAHSGAKLWATNLSGFYNDGEKSYIVSPVINLSPYAGASVIVDWWQWINTEASFDTVYAEATYDGTTWFPLFNFSGNATTWQEENFTLNTIFTTNKFQIRFRINADSDTTFEGYYVDDVTVSVIYPAGFFQYFLPSINK